MSSELRLQECLAELVAFDTQNPSGNERPMAESLAGRLRELGATSIEVFENEGHFSTWARFGTGPSRLLLNAHLDTVPANSGYSAPPHQLTQRGSRLFGLGSADTKGSIAAILEAIALRKESARPAQNTAVLFSGDEERGSVCVHAFLSSERCRGIERAVIGEPTGCRVGRRHRGLCAAALTATSPGGHSSLADSVPNPILDLARVALALEELGDRHRQAGPQGLQGLCMNVAAIDGGVAFNVIPTRATLEFSFRPPPGIDYRALLDEARSAATRAAAPAPLSWEDRAFNPPLETRNVAAFAALLSQPGEAAVDLPYCTEAGQYVAQGIDAVVFGPGHVDQAHSADEYVESGELLRAAAALTRIIP